MKETNWSRTLQTLAWRWRLQKVVRTEIAKVKLLWVHGASSITTSVRDTSELSSFGNKCGVGKPPEEWKLSSLLLGTACKVVSLQTALKFNHHHHSSLINHHSSLINHRRHEYGSSRGGYFYWQSPCKQSPDTATLLSSALRIQHCGRTVPSTHSSFFPHTHTSHELHAGSITLNSRRSLKRDQTRAPAPLRMRAFHEAWPACHDYWSCELNRKVLWCLF